MQSRDPEPKESGEARGETKTRKRPLEQEERKEMQGREPEPEESGEAREEQTADATRAQGIRRSKRETRQQAKAGQQQERRRAKRLKNTLADRGDAGGSAARRENLEGELG
jgi:hypothetical protein